MAAHTRTVLVVDPDAARRGVTAATLSRFGYRVVCADSEDAARAHLAETAIQVLLVARLEGCGSRQSVVEAVRERDPLARVLVQLGPGEAPPARAVVEMLGVHGWIGPDESDATLVSLVASAMVTQERLEHLYLAERLQSELLANVSHEFRTPLAIIIGYIDIIRDGAFGACAPDMQGSLDRVKGNAAYLLELVEEFLDISRSDTHSGPLRVVPLTPFLRELAESFTLLMHEKPVAFVADIPAGLPAVTGDAAKLRVVIQNLLANAVKFTAAGRVALAASVDAEGRAVIEVTDTGPGIPPESKEAIFDLFRQLRPGDRAGGIGLGLALARRFARLFGGDITIESAVGVGSTFTVTLPTLPSVPARPQPAA